MTSTPRRASCWAISSFSAGFSEMPGRLLAVAQRGVEDDDAVGSCHVALPLSASSLRSPVGVRLRGRHALFPPKGEEKKREGGRGTTSAASRPCVSLGTSTTLPTLRRSASSRCASGARSNGTLAATTGRIDAGVEQLAQRGDPRLERAARRPTACSRLRPITALDVAHLLDQVEARHRTAVCGRRWRRLRFSPLITDEAPKAHEPPAGRGAGRRLRGTTRPPIASSTTSNGGRPRSQPEWRVVERAVDADRADRARAWPATRCPRPRRRRAWRSGSRRSRRRRPRRGSARARRAGGEP